MEIITTENIINWVENEYNQDLEEESKENKAIMESKFISVESLKEKLSNEINEFAQREKDNPDSPDVCKANLAGMSIAYQALLEEIEKREE